jgi:hypothetical protein
MFPVVVMPTGVGMVPNDAGGVIVDVETGLRTIDDVGAGIAAVEGDGSAGMAGGCGAGMVAPGKSVMNDVAGCADNASIGAARLPVVGTEEVAGTAEVVGAAEIDDVVPVVAAIEDMEATGTAGVPGAICPVGVEQVTTVPGIVGSEASGTGANVVSGAPSWVAAENGLGPLSGDVTIVAGVDESPMAVVPIVDTCAGLAVQPNSRAAVANSRRRIAFSSFVTI